ncbi:MAG: hypothetical protein GY798_16150 [Hyphomicrobiales bacterium]|nr:hypothetical protein [Hyphomicrobiales bacterium]
MVYRKGELTKRKILADWPHHVRVHIPELGLGTRLDEMHAFCRDMAYQTTGLCLRGESDAALWCFRSAEDAAAFAECFRDVL